MATKNVRKGLAGDRKKPCVLRIGPPRNTIETIGRGTCGSISGNQTTAYKKSKYDNTYWLNEIAIYKFMEKSSHPCVMKPTSFEFTEDRAICEMKRYVRDLEDYKIMSEYHMLVFLLQVSSAIKFLHEHKIIHRDIKPANILMDSSGNFVITDFSHSVIETCNASLFYPTVTSYPYRAPEVFAYQKDEIRINSKSIGEYDEKIDVWSFGAVFLELICQLRFDLLFTEKSSEKTIGGIVCGSNFPKKLEHVLNEHHFATHQFFPDNSPYKEILQGTLCQDPKKRWTSSHLHTYIVKLCKSSTYSEHLKAPSYTIEIPKRKNYAMPSASANCDIITLSEKESHLAKQNFLILSKDIRTNGICKYHFVAAYQITQLLVSKKFLNGRDDREKLVACAALLDALFFDKIHVLQDLCILNQVLVGRVATYLVKLYELVKEDLFSSSYFDFNLAI